MLWPCVSLSAQTGVRINEFLAVNDTGLDDADRGEEDWIELYNAGKDAVNLAGWCLTDKADDLTKWRFPSILLPANGYLTVFASQKDRREPRGELHTNFKLSGQGEYLALVYSDGKTVVSQFDPAYPIQVSDVSYGLAEGRLEPFLSYFPIPTPGRANAGGLLRLGPAINTVSHVPLIPREDEGILVTAHIEPTFDPVESAALHYRIGFAPEVTIPMPHSGRVNATEYGVVIPSWALRAGQMVRWSITAKDTMKRETRYPRFADPVNSPQYCGTVVEDASLTNPLPVFHWFIQNPTAADSDAGTRCSLFYDGEFYDNVLINLHGQSSRGFPKKSYDIDFHPGHNFKWEQGAPRADDINLMTTFPDKAQMRNILAYETYRDAGCPYHWVFPVRVQQNAAFWGTAHVMENGDEDWLIRMGINADGALYKMYNPFTSAVDATSGAEKKTRKYEDNADLKALRAGLSLKDEALRQFLYDNVDVAQVINFLAARTLTGDVDCCHKNYYLYCDTGMSNEWQMWPWDVDLSFGRRWISSMTYWDQTLIANTPLFVGNNNGLPQVFYGTPNLRQMYLRRLRTLMDDLLKPPGTLEKDLCYEPRMDELGLQIAPDAAVDAAKWNSHAWGNGSTAPCCPQSLWEAVNELRYDYFPERRNALYFGLASGAREIPEAQPKDARIDFGQIEFSLAIENPAEEYIQLQNLNDYAVDISGWTLTGHANFQFDGGTVLPAQTFLYVAADRAAFRRRTVYPRGGYALFVVGDYSNSQIGIKTLSLTNRQNRTVAEIEDIESYIPPDFPGTSAPRR
jgi:hypothetical protein